MQFFTSTMTSYRWRIRANLWLHLAVGGDAIASDSCGTLNVANLVEKRNGLQNYQVIKCIQRLLHNATNARSFVVSSHYSEQTVELWWTNLANFHCPATFRYGSTAIMRESHSK